MKINVSLNIRDLYRYYLFNTYTKATYQFFAMVCLISLLSIPFTGLRMSFINNYINDNYKYYSAIVLVISFRLIVPIFYLISPLLHYFNLKDSIKQDKKFGAEIEYLIGDFGLTSESKVYSPIYYTWSKIIKVDETFWYFALFTEKNQATIIPKRCFNNIDALNEFKDTLRKCLPQKIYK